MANIYDLININETNHSKNELVEILRSTFTTYYFCVYILSPIGFVGAILNLICAFVLSKKEFKSRKIFKYLKVYVICSAIICIGLAYIQSLKLYKLVDYTNFYITRVIACYIVRPLVLIALYFSSIMDILVSLERIIAFKPNTVLKSQPILNYFCFLFIVVSMLFNLPLIFSLYPAHIDWKISSHETLNIHYIGVSEFAKSKLGKVLIGLSFFIRDIVPTSVGLFLNIWLILLFKDHVIKKENSLMNKRRFNHVLNSNRCLNEQEQSTAQANLTTEINTLHRTDKTLTFMIIVLSFSTFVEHLIFIVASVSYIVAPCSTTLNINLSVFLFLTIKYSLNIFIFSFFNTRFQSSLRKSFKMGKNKHTPSVL